jgi:hypothetical protein
MNPTPADEILIAPCGMNCGVCLGYLRKKNRCAGCRNKLAMRIPHSVNCVILNCTFLADTESKFCYDCIKYPCRRMKQLDHRYRTKYGTSLMENLEYIKIHGLHSFVIREQAKWHCAACGGTVCIHRGYCLNCKN